MDLKRRKENNMDYEKAYKEALQKAKKLYEQGTITESLSYVFPELAESEDERIRKSIIAIINNYVDKSNTFKPKMLAWLEKQGAQKPTDKVKPKFKVGDWCIDNEDGTIFQIVKVLDNTYTYKTNEGEEYSCTHYLLENDARLWTIQDAKDGDVLAFKDDSYILLVKEVHNTIYGMRVSCYCHVLNGKFETVEYQIRVDGLYPATKEQRDLLFQKMKEAGYKWDVEKKELKKIEQKPTWSEEDEKNLRRAIRATKVVFPEAADWLKFIKQRIGR